LVWLTPNFQIVTELQTVGHGGDSRVMAKFQNSLKYN
jgi:hypothetical protein